MFPRRMNEQHQRPSVTVEQSRGMWFSAVEDDSMITNVQWVLRTFKTKASADVFSQTYGKRRCPDGVIVGVGGTDRVAVDLDRRECDVL